MRSKNQSTVVDHVNLDLVVGSQTKNPGMTKSLTAEIRGALQRVALFGVVTCLVVMARPEPWKVHAAGPEYILEEAPAPTSTDEMQGPVEKGLEPEKERPFIFTPLRRRTAEWSPFFRDAKLDLKTTGS